VVEIAFAVEPVRAGRKRDNKMHTLLRKVLVHDWNMGLSSHSGS
jgi:hypothetical protein